VACAGRTGAATDGARLATAATKDRILDAAETLFASHGFAGTSLRALTREADVNLAAVHYHFGSKEAVLRAVLHRIIDPINAERLARLDAVEARAGGHAPPVEAVLEAFLAPPLERMHTLGARGAVVLRFIGRTHNEPAQLVRDLVREQFQVVAGRFARALGRARPSLPRHEVAWRLHCVVGVLSFLLAQTGAQAVLPGLDPRDAAATTRRLVGFLAPGLRAPMTPGRAAPALAARPRPHRRMGTRR